MALPFPVHASPADLFGTSTRAAALTGNVISTARPHGAVHHNPAALGLTRHLSFAVGFRNSHFSLHLDQSPYAVSEAPALVLGFGIPIPFGGWMKERLALGVAFVMPTQSILVAKIPAPGVARFALLESRAQVSSIQAALGFKIHDAVSWGIGLTALGILDGGVDVAPTPDGNLGSTVKSELLAAYSFHTGLLIRPSASFALAITYREAVTGSFKYPFDVDLGEGFPLPIPRMEIDGIAQYDPAQFAVETTFKPVEKLSLSLGACFKAWRRYANPMGYTAVPPDTPPQPPPGFTDTLSGSVAFEGHFSIGHWLLEPRLGFRYEPSPAPLEDAFHAYLDNHRAILGLGLGTRWKMFRLDVAFQWQHLIERTFLRSAEERSIQHGGDLFFWGIELGADL